MSKVRSIVLAVNCSLLQIVPSAHVVEVHLVIRLLRRLITEDTINLQFGTLVTINDNQRILYNLSLTSNK
jgi:hypothetical protein